MRAGSQFRRLASPADSAVKTGQAGVTSIGRLDRIFAKEIMKRLDIGRDYRLGCFA